MEVQPDFRELLALLNAHEVEYIIVGAYALAFHGAPRFTADLDILVKADSENSNPHPIQSKNLSLLAIIFFTQATQNEKRGPRRIKSRLAFL